MASWVSYIESQIVSKKLHINRERLASAAPRHCDHTDQVDLPNSLSIVKVLVHEGL